MKINKRLSVVLLFSFLVNTSYAMQSSNNVPNRVTVLCEPTQGILGLKNALKSVKAKFNNFQEISVNDLTAGPMNNYIESRRGKQLKYCVEFTETLIQKTFLDSNPTSNQVRVDLSWLDTTIQEIVRTGGEVDTLVAPSGAMNAHNHRRLNGYTENLLEPLNAIQKIIQDSLNELSKNNPQLEAQLEKVSECIGELDDAKDLTNFMTVTEDYPLGPVHTNQEVKTAFDAYIDGVTPILQRIQHNINYKASLERLLFDTILAWITVANTIELKTLEARLDAIGSPEGRCQ